MYLTTNVAHIVLPTHIFAGVWFYSWSKGPLPVLYRRIPLGDDGIRSWCDFTGFKLCVHGEVNRTNGGFILVIQFVCVCVSLSLSLSLSLLLTTSPPHVLGHFLRQWSNPSLPNSSINLSPSSPLWHYPKDIWQGKECQGNACRTVIVRYCRLICVCVCVCAKY